MTRRAEEAAIENKPINILAHLFLQVKSVSKGLNWSKNGMENTRAFLYSVANAMQCIFIFELAFDISRKVLVECQSGSHIHSKQ